MKSQIKTILTTSLLLLATTQVASAHDLGGVTIQKIGYGGNGCIAGSADVLLAADKKSATVAFDDYIVEAGGQGQRTFGRKKCDLSFGLKVPEGFSVALLNAEYRGFTDLPRGARATFTRDYFFAGSRGPRMKKSFRGEQSDDFYIADNLGIMSRVYSKCGADVILRSKTAATVKTKRGREAMMAVDSVDISSKTIFRYNFSWRKC